MDLAIDVILRLMHIFAAITAVGGIFFMRLALLPAVDVLPDEASKQLHTAIRARWSKVVMACILFLLVSGMINFINIVKAKDEIELAPYYHALFGIKFVLAMAIFFISSLLSGRSAAADRFRKNTRYWLTINMLLAIVLITISGVLRSSKSPIVSEDSAKATFFDQSFVSSEKKT